MVKKQCKSVYDLAIQQFKKIQQDIEKIREVKKLANEQVWDDSKEHIKPNIITPKTSNRNNFQHLKLREKAVMVLAKSEVFTFEEIAQVLNIHRNTVRNIHERLRSA